MTDTFMPTIYIVLGFLVTSATSSPVSVRLHSESSNNTFVHINFYEDDFLKFYWCMVASTTLTCTADLTRDQKQPHKGDDRRVTGIDKLDLLRTVRGYSDIFTCGLSLDDQQLTCTRLLINASTCGRHIVTQFFHFMNESSVTVKCAGIRWKNAGESLIYNNSADFIEVCNISCVTGSRNTSTVKNDHTRLPNDSTWPSPTDETPRNITRRWHRKDDDDDDDDDKTHIIIAVVVSVVVTVSLAIAGFLFRRQLIRMTLQANGNASNGIVENSLSNEASNTTGGQLGKTNHDIIQHPDSNTHHPQTV